MASGETVLEAFWKWVLAKLACVVCKRFEPSGQDPSLHHIAEGSGVRSVFAMCPLCHLHHQGALGFHGMGGDAFIRIFRPPGDSEYGMLVWVIEDVAELFRRWLHQLGVKRP
jgi:hypothetical protein